MKLKTLLLPAVLGAMSIGAVSAQEPDISDLEERIARLEKALSATLKSKNAADQRQQEKDADDFINYIDSEFGPEKTASLSWANKTSIGGYGELHFNMSLSDNGDQVDFHRWVLFVNHEFSDRIKLFSEFELEHSLSGDGKPGEVELEQAYLQFDTDGLWSFGGQINAGLFLMPVGITNETHEPNTFYGVERNNVEKYIIPTTWWESGIGFTKRTDNGFQFDLALTSSLSVTDSYTRGGRQKAAKHKNPEIAYTGRVKYTGIEGLELASTAQYNPEISDNTDATLLTAHAIYQKGGFGLKALYATWHYGGESNNPNQDGFYIEPSYRFDTPIGDVGVFARYANYNYQASQTTSTSTFADTGNPNPDGTLPIVSSSTASSNAIEAEEITFGVNYWPHENVVLKADLNYLSSEKNGVDQDNKNTLNLGIGYQF